MTNVWLLLNRMDNKSGNDGPVPRVSIEGGIEERSLPFAGNAIRTFPNEDLAMRSTVTEMLGRASMVGMEHLRQVKCDDSSCAS